MAKRTKRHSKHSKIKAVVKCGKRVVSRHRKVTAARKAKPSRKGCRVVKY
jgi:hypothetical protein